MKTVNLGPIGNRSGSAIEKALYEAGLLDTSKWSDPPDFDNGGYGLVWAERHDDDDFLSAYAMVDDAADEATVLSIANGPLSGQQYILQEREDIEILIDVLAEELSVDRSELQQKFLDKKAVSPKKVPRAS